LRGNAIIRKDIIAQHMQYSLEPFLLLKLLRLHHWNFSIKEKKRIAFLLHRNEKNRLVQKSPSKFQLEVTGNTSTCPFPPWWPPLLPLLSTGVRG
jgi:hypothetical protein